MSILHNDEGMWLPDDLPTDHFQKQFGVTPTDEWSEHIMKASARLNSGGSASFVSPDGLLITNHHVAESILQDMSSPEKDYVKDGFLAKTRSDEVEVPHEEVNVLWEVEDVTERVQGAVNDKMSAGEAHKARLAEIARTEDESYKKTGLRSDVVSLYNGGLYHLYRYKKYTDVRLVFAPEYAIAGFGGDFDNYEFPRFNLDAAFLRVYEGGKPARTEHYFRWAEENPEEGQVLFVTGHPGSTDRLSTLARIKHLRDSGLPYQLNLFRRMEVVAQQFAGKSPENKRIAHGLVHGAQNMRKRFDGQLAGLLNPAFLKEKEKEEDELQQAVEGDADMKKKFGDAWEQIGQAEVALRGLRDEMNLLEGGLAFSSNYFGIARTLLRMEEEDKKESHDRLPEYADANRESLLESLLSPAPIYSEFEIHKLADSLTYMAERLGFDNEIVQRVLNGLSPADRARELVSGTKLGSVDVRKQFASGDGMKPSESLDRDAFLALAQKIDEHARAVRKQFEERVDEVRRQAYAKIAAARFKIYGTEVYPDATFTLRVAGGRVRGYEEGGEYVSPHTTISGTFAHAEKHENKDPWKLPKQWRDRREKLADSKAAFNFVTTHDTHGGNSGSPVVDKDMRIHGVLFDGNIHANANTFMYRDEVERAVSVHTAGITTALASVYHADALLGELREAAKS